MTKTELKQALETVAHVAGPTTTLVVVIRELIERLPDDVPPAAAAPTTEPLPLAPRSKKG